MTVAVRNGWRVLRAKAYTEQVTELEERVETLQRKHPAKWQRMADAKRLAALRRIETQVIPADPASPVFLQGNTFGPTYRQWRRVKFLQQYRLFFRYDTASKTIILGWVNDEKTKRAYDSRDDAYRVFTKMLDDGNPPDDWNDLLKDSE